MQCFADFIGNSFVIQPRFFASCLKQIKSYASRHRKAFRRKHIPSTIHRNHPLHQHQHYDIIDANHQFQNFNIIHSFINLNNALAHFICILFISISFILPIRYLIFYIRFASVKQDHFLNFPLKCS